jgi:hypothetical protein
MIGKMIPVNHERSAVTVMLLFLRPLSEAPVFWELPAGGSRVMDDPVGWLGVHDEEEIRVCINQKFQKYPLVFV